MKKSLIKILCCFIPSKNMRHKIRAAAENRRNLGGKTFTGLTIKSTSATNNVIIHGKSCDYNFHNCSFILEGENCQIEIYPSDQPINNLKIHFPRNVSNCRVHIGSNFGCQSVNILVNDCNNIVEIGERCMFSWGIQILSSDGHAIFDNNSGKVLNKSSKIKIGNHCWIGCDVKVLKNVSLADDIICGASSIVSKSVSEAACIIAGSPAQIVKRNVSWNGDLPNSFE